MFVTWEAGDEQGRAIAMRAASEAVRDAEPVVRSQGSNLFLNVAPQNVSVRDGYSRNDYDGFRREDAIPSNPKDVIRACMRAYKGIGPIRNIIDLMADFASQGIDVVHPNERIEKWYKEWFRRVGGKERSERFLNYLYRTAHVIVKRRTAKLSIAQADDMKRANGEADIEVTPPTQTGKREIPWRYTFLNPLSIDVVAPDLSLFVGQDEFTFAVRLPDSLIKKIKSPKSKAERDLVAKLPKDVVAAANSGDKTIVLDPQKTKGFFYKRDDWDTWASPMIEAILPDLQMLQKMKLADLAALDGAISCIRVWKLGDIANRILPTPAAIARLAEMLCNNVGGGVMDLVWGPELNLEETSTEAYKFLGQTKYEPVLTAIYAGLGIPPTLTGAQTSGGGGFTNNFISLKTLTERLQYGRDTLTAFWEEEIRIVQKAMGFRFPASLAFDRMVLTDEAAEKQLLISLADRDLISTETLMERFGETPEIEQVRIRREARKRRDGLAPPKASPFHKAEKEHELKMGFVAQKTVTPSEVGLELDPRKDGEKSPAEIEAKLAPKPVTPSAPKGQPGQGRPKNTRDTKPRKQKTVKPRTKASSIFLEMFSWAENAQAKINQISAPAYLASVGKKTIRDLSDKEQKRFESFKFRLLCQIKPGQKIDEQEVARLSKGSLSLPAEVASLLKETIARHVETNGRQPGPDTLRRYQAGVYAFMHGDFDEAEEIDE